jgi:hypothetical protein
MNNSLNANEVRRAVNNMTNYKLLRIWTASGKGESALLSRLPSHYGNTNKPNFIIKWGPPASGKGSQAVKDTIASMGWPLDTYVNFNIDDAVQATELFKRESTRRAQEYLNKVRNDPNKKNLNLTTINGIVNALNTINSNSALKIGKAYTNIRNGVGTNGRKLGAKMDAFLQQAIELRKNITFETTGMGGFPEWLFSQKGLSDTNYNIHIIFPIVSFETSWARYRRRAAEMLIRNRAGFRFASWKDEARKQYRKSYDKFLGVVDESRQIGLLKTITVIRPSGTPVRYFKTNRPGLRSANLPEIRRIVAAYKNSNSPSNNGLQ